MTHAESGTLLSYLDGELAGPQARTLEDHLASCGACREDLEGVRTLAMEVSGALGLIPVEAPLAEARARFARERAAANRQESARPARPWRFATAGLLKAAAVVLLVAGAVSAAIPGSPVRRWAAALLLRAGVGDAPAPVQVVEPPAPTPGGTAGQTASVSTFGLPVQGGQVRVSVRSTDPEARIVVRQVDGEGGIHSMSPSETLRYRTGPGYVEVFDVRAGVVIEIPKTLRAATVEVNGQVFWRKDVDGIEILQPAVQGSGDEAVFRARS